MLPRPDVGESVGELGPVISSEPVVLADTEWPLGTSEFDVCSERGLLMELDPGGITPV